MRADGPTASASNPSQRPETRGFRNLLRGYRHPVQWIRRLVSRNRRLVPVPGMIPGSGVVPRLCLVVLAIGLAATGCAEDPVDRQTAELYRQGNLLYEGGKFAEASRTYERIIERGIRNGHVYYNLGNAYYKQDRIGLAILAYERATRLMPRDGDLHNNLDLAKERTTDEIAGEVPWFGRQALDGVTVNEATVAATSAGFLASLALVGFLLARRPRTRSVTGYALLVSCLVLLMAAGFLGIKIYDSLVNEEAIVLQPTAEVRTSPDASSEPVFTLHEGAKVQLVEHRDDWLRIRLPDGKNGWLSQDDLEGI